METIIDRVEPLPTRSSYPVGVAKAEYSILVPGAPNLCGPTRRLADLLVRDPSDALPQAVRLEGRPDESAQAFAEGAFQRECIERGLNVAAVPRRTRRATAASAKRPSEGGARRQVSERKERGKNTYGHLAV